MRSTGINIRLSACFVVIANLIATGYHIRLAGQQWSSKIVSKAFSTQSQKEQIYPPSQIIPPFFKERIRKLGNQAAPIIKVKTNL